MKQVIGKVLYNSEISQSYFKMGIACSDVASSILPGQFFMLRAWSDTEYDPLLNRPFGVYRVIGEEEGVEILYRVVGRGTRIMSQLRHRDFVGLIGPLGKGFPIYEYGDSVAMISGGVGIAPFYFFTQWIRNKKSYNLPITLYHGGSGMDDMVCIEDFEALGVEIKSSTEDGSVGFKGYVTDNLRKDLEKKNIMPSFMLACGPKAMLKEVALMALKDDIPCFVSIDSVMGCGIGTCLGCVVKTRKKDKSKADTEFEYTRVCMEGPVFDVKDILWEKL